MRESINYFVIFDKIFEKLEEKFFAVTHEKVEKKKY
jgi:hypothetical protein